jgi:hypothetical protein
VTAYKWHTEDRADGLIDLIVNFNGDEIQRIKVNLPLGTADIERNQRARLESWIASVAHDAVRWTEQTWRIARG